MKKIFVKANDGSFEKICELIDTNVLGSDIKHTSDGILTENYLFIKDLSGSVDKDEEIKMTNDGSSWFLGFRNKFEDQKQSSMAIWKSFVESIVSKFHKKYSYLEYLQNDTSNLEEKAKVDTAMIQNFFKLVLPSTSGCKIDIVNISEKSKSNIYGTTLKMSITDGSGEAKIVLGKLLFEKDKYGRMTPLAASEAKQVCNAMAAVEDDSDRPVNNDDRNKSLGTLLNELEKMFTNKNVQMNKYLAFVDEEDNEVVENFVERGPNDNVELDCLQAKLLSVFHVEWGFRQYDVSIDDNLLYRFVFGVGDSFSLICKSCGESIIKSGNFSVVYPNHEVHNIVLNSKIENFGLTKNDIDDLILLYNSHNIRVNCPDNIRNPNCVRYVCKGKGLILNVKGEDRLFCKDCPYIEVITYIDGTPYYTQSLNFDREKMTLTNEPAKVCKICGRKFTSLDEDGYCKTCCELKKNLESSKALYKKYSYMLPISIRASYDVAKLCVEDSEVVIFRVGEDCYRFNKSDMSEGILKTPEIIGKSKEKQL